MSGSDDTPAHGSHLPHDQHIVFPSSPRGSHSHRSTGGGCVLGIVTALVSLAATLVVMFVRAVRREVREQYDAYAFALAMLASALVVADVVALPAAGAAVPGRASSRSATSHPSGAVRR